MRHRHERPAERIPSVPIRRSCTDRRRRLSGAGQRTCRDQAARRQIHAFRPLRLALLNPAPTAASIPTLSETRAILLARTCLSGTRDLTRPTPTTPFGKSAYIRRRYEFVDERDLVVALSRFAHLAGHRVPMILPHAVAPPLQCRARSCDEVISAGCISDQDLPVTWSGRCTGAAVCGCQVNEGR
jgi:hypothetical protein